MTTTGVFRHIDNTKLTGKAWSKVDAYQPAYDETERRRPVHDLRVAGLDNFTTDNCGFAVHNWPATEKEFTDDRAVREGYYAEVEALLRAKLPGIKKIINVWRPIGHPAADFPLAVVDWRTIKPSDLVATDLLYPIRPPDDDGDNRGKEVAPEPGTHKSAEGYVVGGETFAVAPSDAHKFYYVKDMTPDEAMFLKCFDSRSQERPGGIQGLAGMTPHTAFVDPATPADAKGRQSIEVRCLVFYD
ncbi:hypothetical protein RB601_008377 [Gaeumannomyces tritici]